MSNRSYSLGKFIFFMGVVGNESAKARCSGSCLIELMKYFVMEVEGGVNSTDGLAAYEHNPSRSRLSSFGVERLEVGVKGS